MLSREKYGIEIRCCLELVPLRGKHPKNGVLSPYKNWRGILLLSVASKVLCKIILERRKDSLDDKIRDKPAAFRDPAVNKLLH